jgi:hypothetical protein
MKSYFFYLLFLLCFFGSYAQKGNVKEVDSLYKEDHFYAGISYNLLTRQPSGLSQDAFSLGFNLGYIKDMPINKARNKAFGVGIGYSTNSYNQNMLIEKNENGEFEYSILNDRSTYTKNKFSTNLIEVPIEYRWRTSTPSDYEFWRIYVGFKLGYIITHTSKYDGDLGRLRYRNNDDFNNLQYGLMLSFGYNTWNFQVNYGLNSLFSKNAQIDGQSVDFNDLKIGLIFYML